jgi:hypothetical protein
VTASVSFIFGILLGAIVLFFANRRKPDAGLPSSKPTTLGWLTLAFGLTAVAAFAVAAWLTTGSNDHGAGLWLISIAFGFAAVVDGVGTLMKHDRHWPTWVGLVAGLAPAVFWIAFAAAHILGFGD